MHIGSAVIKDARERQCGRKDQDPDSAARLPPSRAIASMVET